MPYTASAFQQIMSLVKLWWLRSFEGMLVDGQLALVYDDARQAQVDAIASLLRAAQAHTDLRFHSSPWIQTRGWPHRHDLFFMTTSTS